MTAAGDGGRVGTVIELEVLRATAHQAAGEPDEALDALEHAVDLAEADGWLRVFVDAGPALTELLRELARRRPHSGYVRELLGAASAAEGAAGVPTGEPSAGAAPVDGQGRPGRNWSTR